ncbi:MAG: BamA/TamA family outer membrane protein [Bacteroidota bacterium]
MKNSRIVLLILILATDLFAQEKDYKIEYVNSKNKELNLETGRADSSTFILKINSIKNQLLSKSYLLANIDEVHMDSSLQYAKINVGDKFLWQAMGIENIPEVMLSKAGYRKTDFEDTDFSEKEFNRLINKLLSEASNNGYPYASFKLKDISIQDNKLNAVLNYDAGPVIYFDSLTVRPENFIKARFLESYLDVKEGDLFTLKSANKIYNAFSLLPYCKLSDSVQISFQNNLCNINLQVDPVKANKIDALIGFLPDQEEGKGFLLSGFVNLHLHNLFKSGKELSFVWRKFQKESQTLKLNYNHPNLFRSPMGVGFIMDIIKQDSAFYNTDIQLSAFYYKDRLRISFSTDLITSRSLSTPIDPFVVPDILDFNIQQLGVEVSHNTLDDLNNPLNGIRIYSGVKLGNKKILKSPDLAENIYDSLDLKSTQSKIKIGGEINKRVTGSLVFHLDASSGWIINNDQLYLNDLFRLGGINSIRGFNDLDILVSSYMLFRFEPRLVLNSSSRLFMFYDQGFTNNSVTNLKDKPRGFGAGLVLDTGLGDLQLVYALGISDQQSLSLTQSRIHIGYVARF